MKTPEPDIRVDAIAHPEKWGRTVDDLHPKALAWISNMWATGVRRLSCPKDLWELLRRMLILYGHRDLDVQYFRDGSFLLFSHREMPYYLEESDLYGLIGLNASKGEPNVVPFKNWLLYRSNFWTDALASCLLELNLFNIDLFPPSFHSTSDPHDIDLFEKEMEQEDALLERSVPEEEMKKAGAFARVVLQRIEPAFFRLTRSELCQRDVLS